MAGRAVVKASHTAVIAVAAVAVAVVAVRHPAGSKTTKSRSEATPATLTD